ncbi:MAG: 2-succinyl-6-hydroxy-2,4-cyclohexadiene-1-carboxy late synthase [Dehalococcoidia bacterium]
MTRYEVAPGCHLNVDVAGSGPPLVLLHGFTGSARSWGEFGEALARAFTTIAVDIVGHGASDSPAALDHYRMPRAVAGIVRAVELAGYPRAHWLGYSMGGRTALHVAAAFPRAVDRLVLIGASPGIQDPAERAARVASDEALAARIERDGIECFVDYWEDIPLFATQRRLPAEVRARIRAGRLASNPTGLANSLRGMGAGAQEPIHAQLGTMTMPALVLAGSEDAKYVEVGQSIATAMPRARFARIRGAGHAAHIEAPGTCAAAVISFLQEKEQP